MNNWGVYHSFSELNLFRWYLRMKNCVCLIRTGASGTQIVPVTIEKYSYKRPFYGTEAHWSHPFPAGTLFLWQRKTVCTIDRRIQLLDSSPLADALPMRLSFLDIALDLFSHLKLGQKCLSQIEVAFKRLWRLPPAFKRYVAKENYFEPIIRCTRVLERINGITGLKNPEGISTLEKTSSELRIRHFPN